jgi:glyoxylase-like metal-dependent hydrolase (beta-lactamase superfamily II)
VAIEQRDHVVLVEAPQDEKRSLAVIAKVGKLIPGKPIRYVVNTHAHFGHSGGLRTLVDAGAVVVTPQANRRFYEQAWAAPHTIAPDLDLAHPGRAGGGAKCESCSARACATRALTSDGHADAHATSGT